MLIIIYKSITFSASFASYFLVSDTQSWTSAMISFNTETVNSDQNLPLKNSLIKFDAAIATLENLLKMTFLNRRLNKTDMEIVLDCSKLFYYKASREFLRQNLQSSYSFGKIQNVGETKLSEEKNLVFHWKKSSYFVFIYIFPLVLLLISSFQIHNLELARWFLLTLKH